MKKHADKNQRAFKNMVEVAQTADTGLLLFAHRLLVLGADGLEGGSPHLVAFALHRIILAAGLIVADLHDALAAGVVEHVRSIGHDGSQIVHHLAGVVNERTDHIGIATAIGAAHILVDDLFQIVRAKTPTLQQFGKIVIISFSLL